MPEPYVWRHYAPDADRREQNDNLGVELRIGENHNVRLELGARTARDLRRLLTVMIEDPDLWGCTNPEGDVKVIRGQLGGTGG